MILPALRDHIVDIAPLARSPIHGMKHWDAVGRNGRRLIGLGCPANLRVVEMFALLHDAGRTDEDQDPDHGLRSAGIVIELDRGRWFTFTAREMELLLFAVRWHPNGYTTSNPTIGACWDADRLDLGRVDVEPDPSMLSTDEAKSLTR